MLAGSHSRALTMVSQMPPPDRWSGARAARRVPCGAEGRKRRHVETGCRGRARTTCRTRGAEPQLSATVADGVRTATTPYPDPLGPGREQRL